jgi:hypothetical protein
MGIGGNIYENKEIVFPVLLIFFLYILSITFHLGDYLDIFEHVLLGFLLAEFGNRFYVMTRKFNRLFLQISFVAGFAIAWELLEFLGYPQRIIPGLKTEFILSETLKDLINNFVGLGISVCYRLR